MNRQGTDLLRLEMLISLVLTGLFLAACNDRAINSPTVVLLSSAPIASATTRPISTPILLTPSPTAPATIPPINIPPVQPSPGQLALAKQNLAPFSEQLPFLKSLESQPIQEYYGCTDSNNAGLAINYSVTKQTAETIKVELIEYFEQNNIDYTGWGEFNIPGYLGFAWEINASFHPDDRPHTTVIIHGSLLEYKLRNTPEPPAVEPTYASGIPPSQIHLSVNYFRSPDQVIGAKSTDLLKTCKTGWWLKINPDTWSPYENTPFATPTLDDISTLPYLSEIT